MTLILTSARDASGAQDTSLLTSADVNDELHADVCSLTPGEKSDTSGQPFAKPFNKQFHSQPDQPNSFDAGGSSHRHDHQAFCAGEKSLQETPLLNNYAPGGNEGPKWIEPIAGPGFTQFNGSTYHVDGDSIEECVRNKANQKNLNSCTFVNPIKIGHGNQFNGCVYETDEDSKRRFGPLVGSVWINPMCLPSHPPGMVNERLGMQFNGHIIKIKNSTGAEDNKR